MHFRELSDLDAEAMASLWHAGALESGLWDPAFLPRASVKIYAERLRSDFVALRLFGWGAFDTEALDSSLRGYLTAEVRKSSPDWAQDDILYILDVDVEQASRRNGIANRLVGLAFERASRNGIRRVELSWITNDPRSYAVWTSLGFVPYLTRGYVSVEQGDRHDA